jgi:maleylacetate reductase
MSATHAMDRIAQALNGASAPQAVFDLAKVNGAPLALKDIGMNASELDKACAIALENQYPNPRPLEKAAIRQLLQDAYEGVRPQD